MTSLSSKFKSLALSTKLNFFWLLQETQQLGLVTVERGITNMNEGKDLKKEHTLVVEHEVIEKDGKRIQFQVMIPHLPGRQALKAGRDVVELM